MPRLLWRKSRRPTASTPKSDEERLNCEDGTTDIEAWPPDTARATREYVLDGRHRRTGPTTHPAAGILNVQTRAAGEGTNPLANDAGPRNETARRTDVLADYFAAIRAGNEDRLRALLAAGPPNGPEHDPRRGHAAPRRHRRGASRKRAGSPRSGAPTPTGTAWSGARGRNGWDTGEPRRGPSEIHGTPLQLAARARQPGDGEAAGGDV